MTDLHRTLSVAVLLAVLVASSMAAGAEGIVASSTYRPDVLGRVGVVAAGQETAEAIHHEDVMEVGRRAQKQFTSLLTALIPQIATLTS